VLLEEHLRACVEGAKKTEKGQIKGMALAKKACEGWSPERRQPVVITRSPQTSGWLYNHSRCQSIPNDRFLEKVSLLIPSARV
jgi:hypothetical protein